MGDYGEALKTCVDAINADRIYKPVFEMFAPGAQWGGHNFQRGDRVRIKEGYDGAGDVYYYAGKDIQTPDSVLVAESESQASLGTMRKYRFLADAIELYPYTREERIERAIEDLYKAAGWRSPEVQEAVDGSDADYRAVLFAILDAGV